MARRPVGVVAVVTAAVVFAALPSRDSRAAAGAEGGPELVMLRPGTVVGESAPKGWTSLVLKSVPRIESGDLDTLPTIAHRTATLFRTVIVADVRRPAEGGAYRLRRLGLGLAVPFDGADTVVTTADDTPAHAALGFVEAQVLGRAEGELRKGRILAATPTFALFGGPCTLKTRAGHVGVWILYAFLVDPETGALTTVAWAVPADPASNLAPATVVRLAPRLVYTCGLDVAAEKLLGTVPVNWSFAARSLPPGTVVVIPRDQRARFLHARTDGAALEPPLRALVSQSATAANARPVTP